MSLKSKRNSPRAMPVETIVTRYKSSQLKQCNKTVKVNKHASQHKQPSKHNINSTNKQKRRKAMGKADKKDNNVCGEFHSDKLKRKMEKRKVILKPKHDYKVVIDANNCNKRKLNVPIKDVKRIRTNSESSVSSQGSVHTISEMITLLDASDNLNDEDLMEILTCPSPVWWEDPPPGYKEDSLSAQFTQRNKKPQDEFITQNLETKLKYQEKNESDNDKSKIDTNKIKLNAIVNEKDSKYLNKRSKLEALLGNIKDKVKNNKQSNYQNEEICNDTIKVNNHKQPNNQNEENSNDIIEVKDNKQSNNKNDEISNDTITVNNHKQPNNQNDEISNDSIKIKNDKQSNNKNDEISNDIIVVKIHKQSNDQNEENKLVNNISYKSIKENIKIGKPVIKSPDVYLDKIKQNKSLNISKYNNQSVNTTNSKSSSMKTNRSLLLHDYMFIPNSDIDNIEIDKKVNSIDNSDKINENISNNSRTIENNNIPNSNINSESNVDDVIDLNSDETDDELINTSLDDDTLSILENMQIPIHDSGITDSTIDNNSSTKLGTTDSEIIRTKNIDRSTKDNVDKSEITLIEGGGKTNANSDPNKTAPNISKELEKDSSDFITVYKIISSENEKNRNINSYFKKSKFRPNKSLDNPNDDTIDSSGERKIVVATKEIVKYCL